jgi:hypothetical protein
VLAPYASKFLYKIIHVTDLEEIKQALSNDKIHRTILCDLKEMAKKLKFSRYGRIRNVSLEA